MSFIPAGITGSHQGDPGRIWAPRLSCQRCSCFTNGYSNMGDSKGSCVVDAITNH